MYPAKPGNYITYMGVTMFYFSDIYDRNYQKLQKTRREIVEVILGLEIGGDASYFPGRGTQAILGGIKVVLDWLKENYQGQWRDHFKPEHLALYDSISEISADEGEKAKDGYFPFVKAIVERAVKELTHNELKVYLVSCSCAHNGDGKNEAGMGPGEFFHRNKAIADMAGVHETSVPGIYQELQRLGYIERMRGHKSRSIVRRVCMLPLKKTQEGQGDVEKQDGRKNNVPPKARKARTLKTS
jgi:hypothetical protein